MLHPEYFDTAADDILAIYEKLDQSGVAAICKRLARLDKVTGATVWQAYRLQEAGLLYNEMISMIGAATGKSEKAIKQLFEEAAIEAIEYDDSIYRAAGLSPLPLQLSPSMLLVLQAGLEKTNRLMKNLTLTTAVSSQQAYIQAADLAYMQVSTGLMDYQTAIAQAVKTAAQKGLSVLYPSGHIDSLDVAIRRACLTGVNQTCAQVQITRADDMNCDLVETTAHVGARPSHQDWQGQVFSRSERSTKYRPFSATGYGTGSGLCGWNCRHSFFPFFEGLSESAYPREQLDEYKNKTVKYNGDEISYYEATQVQRRMEREIRKTKRTLTGIDTARKEADNPALQAEFTKQSVKLKQQQRKLKEFCQETGLYRRANHEQVYASKGGGFDRSVAQKAVWANKRVEKSKQRGTIELTDEEHRALNKYISSGSFKINYPLRKDLTLTAEQELMIKNLDSALSKMPIYQGTVYRSLNDDEIDDIDEFLKQHSVGAYRKFPSYLSSGTAVYDESFPIQYVIESKTGKDIRAYNPNENEILFVRNTGFYVTKIQGHTIYLKEK